MQALKDNFFYHSNSRLAADGGLEDERQLLVEKQRSCRAQARRFSQETNRRRKALEERRKQWDVQEQRLRENILQQRRQRVQDATERFQRAHLPPSQRRRQCSSFRRKTPTIEDALNHIQGNLNSYTRQSSFLSSSSNLSRSCSPSPKPPTGSRSPHRRALSAVEAYARLLQEHSTTSGFKGSQQFCVDEIQKREQDACSPQDHHVYHLNHSESLSSLDSLENEDPNHNTVNLQCSYSSLLLDSEKPQTVQKNQNDLCQSSGLSSSSTTALLGNILPQLRRMHDLKPKKQEEFEVLNNRMHNPSQATPGFTSVEQASKMEAQPPLGNCRLLSLCEIIDADEEHCEESSPQNSPNDKITVLANDKIPLSNTALEFNMLDLRHQSVHDDRHAKHPTATEIILPAENSSHKDILFEAPPKPNVFLKECTTDNASQEETVQQAGEVNNYLSSQKSLSDSINNLNKLSNLEPKTDKSINVGSLQQACLSNIKSDTPKCLKCPEEEKQKIPLPVETFHSDSKICQVRFIKGILKKQSKYVAGDNTYEYGSGHLFFAKQVAVSIRDSVELTRVKARDVEANKTVKKKLRWLDEVNLEKEEQEQNINIRKQMRGKSSSVSQSKSNSEDHQPSLTTVSGGSRTGPSLTPPASSGYHFTKQAWADVGVQVSMAQERGDEVKVPRSSTRTGGPKVPRREHSARVGASPVSSRTRKGAVIRPQSATEVSQIAKTQGKILVPRPPPKMETAEESTLDKTMFITKTPYSMDHPSVNFKQALPVEQASHKDDPESFYSPYTHRVIRTDSSVVYTPLTPSYTYPVLEGSSKSAPSSGHQEAQSCSGRRGLVYNEKGLCLDCTPTDEEISQLWHGVRTALATKDGDSINVLTHNGLLSALSQARANLSHVTISGDSLISGVKAITGLGGFLLSPPNGRNLVRKPALEGSGVRRRMCVELNRQHPCSGNRRFPLPSQPTRQTTDPVRLFSKTYETALPDEGLQSAAQFHLAEKHSDGPLEEKDIMAAMETAQTQRPGLGTLSLEEQRILLSLDRLNQQLHGVQGHVGSAASMRGHVHIDVSPAKEGKAAAPHKNRAFSADSRSRNPRKI
ncbi:centrosomal protein of 126 kDa [Myripristis murdjan]|uniref:centrosomal protein of 126 kDa n=1 Tax=Myripristis murdjan TaxID=586833 RepID=UPI00117649F4|nr:centrosomal protein of 126 kDa [Myripristis murdjan]